MENRILIREFNEAKDVEVVGKLEKNCEIGSKNGVALFTNMITDPLSRIRFYAAHVMLVGLFFFLSWATAYIYMQFLFVIFVYIFTFIFNVQTCLTFFSVFMIALHYITRNAVRGNFIDPIWDLINEHFNNSLTG